MSFDVHPILMCSAVCVHMSSLCSISLDLLYALFDGVWFPSNPSSLPLCVGFPRSPCGLGVGEPWRSHRSSAMFSMAQCVSPPPTRFGSSRFRPLPFSSPTFSPPPLRSHTSSPPALLRPQRIRPLVFVPHVFVPCALSVSPPALRPLLFAPSSLHGCGIHMPRFLV